MRRASNVLVASAMTMWLGCSEVDKLTESDIQQISNDIYLECRVAGITAVDDEELDVWERPAYQTPDWWESAPSRPDRMGGTGLSS